MRSRVARGLLVLAAVVVAAGALVFALAPASTPGSGLSASSATLTIAKHFSLHLEHIGGCPEAQLDGGRDVDPFAHRDVEDDECLPGQHRARAPDGAPLHPSGS